MVAGMEVRFVLPITGMTCASCVSAVTNALESVPGVNGVSVVGHGSAQAQAVSRAIETAKQVADTGFVAQMFDDLGAIDSRLGE